MTRLTPWLLAPCFGALVGCGAAPPRARTDACDRATPALEQLAQTAFFLQHFRAGGSAERSHADLVDERAARIGDAPGDEAASRVFDRVRAAARDLSAKLRVVESHPPDRAHESPVQQSAGGLRAALDEAGEVCGRTFSAFASSPPTTGSASDAPRAVASATSEALPREDAAPAGWLTLDVGDGAAGGAERTATPATPTVRYEQVRAHLDDQSLRIVAGRRRAAPAGPIEVDLTIVHFRAPGAYSLGFAWDRGASRATVIVDDHLRCMTRGPGGGSVDVTSVPSDGHGRVEGRFVVRCLPEADDSRGPESVFHGEFSATLDAP